MPEIHPGWQSANDDTYLRYRRADGAEVTTLRTPTKISSKPWMAKFNRNLALRGKPNHAAGGYGAIRRFGTALTAILALEEVERKREGTNG